MDCYRLFYGLFSFSLTGSLPIVTTAEMAIFLGSVHCSGDEPRFADCRHTPTDRCSRGELAGVRCEGMHLSVCYITCGLRCFC